MAEITRLALLELLLSTENNRHRAKIETGSFLMEDALRLHQIVVDHPHIRTAVEWGTYLGRSALAIASAMIGRVNPRVFTCDSSNDAFPTITYENVFLSVEPFTTSTAMLTKLVEHDNQVDLFFFDGFIMQNDPKLISHLATPQTLYVFDDFTGNLKGTRNVEIMKPMLDDTHRIVYPVRGSALAMYVPK